MLVGSKMKMTEGFKILDIRLAYCIVLVEELSLGCNAYCAR